MPGWPSSSNFSHTTIFRLPNHHRHIITVRCSQSLLTLYLTLSQLPLPYLYLSVYVLRLTAYICRLPLRSAACTSRSYPLALLGHGQITSNDTTTVCLAALEPASDPACADLAVSDYNSDQERLILKKGRFGWFVGHLTLLIATLRYGLSYLTFHPSSFWAVTSYRVAFMAAAATYGIVVYKGVRARARSGASQPGGNLALITDENVQYLGRAFTMILK